MRKVTFEEDELLVMAMCDMGNRQDTQKLIEEVIPVLEDDEEMWQLVVNTFEKIKRLSDIEYHKMDLEPYKQEPEEDE